MTFLGLFKKPDAPPLVSADDEFTLGDSVYNADTVAGDLLSIAGDAKPGSSQKERKQAQLAAYHRNQIAERPVARKSSSKVRITDRYQENIPLEESAPQQSILKKSTKQNRRGTTVKEKVRPNSSLDTTFVTENLSRKTSSVSRSSTASHRRRRPRRADGSPIPESGPIDMDALLEDEIVVKEKAKKKEPKAVVVSEVRVNYHSQKSLRDWKHEQKRKQYMNQVFEEKDSIVSDGRTKMKKIMALKKKQQRENKQKRTSSRPSSSFSGSDRSSEGRRSTTGSAERKSRSGTRRDPPATGEVDPVKSAMERAQRQAADDEEFGRIQQKREAYLKQQRKLEQAALLKRLATEHLHAGLEEQDSPNMDAVSVQVYDDAIEIESSYSDPAKDALSTPSTSNPSSISEDDRCVVCNYGERTHMATPCGHRAVCEDCVQSLKHQGVCPMCHQGNSRFTTRTSTMFEL